MCNALKDGGLRCAGHVKPELASLKNEYSQGLVQAALEADIPVTEGYLENVTKEFETSYLQEEAEFNAQKEALKQELLKAHESAMEAKKALEAVPHGRDASIADILGNVFGKKEPREARPTLEEIYERPDLKNFKEKEEYVENRQLVSALYGRIKEQSDLMKKKMDRLAEQRLEDLHTNNPNLKRLRTRANMSRFANMERAYDDERAYVFELADVRFSQLKTVTRDDFPELKEQIEQDEASLKANEDYTAVLREKYYTHDLATNTRARFFSTTELDGQISRMGPVRSSIESLKYKVEKRKFLKLKDEYTEFSSKEFNVDKAKEEFQKAQLAKTLPFDKEKMKTFKTEVYDKKPEVVKLRKNIQKKSRQLHLSSEYRKDLKTRADKALLNGNTVSAETLLKKKQTLDSLAEIEKGKNRLKTIAS